MSAIGPLRHRLTHQTFADLPDGAGGIARSFVTVGQLWGALAPVSADFALGEERARASHLLNVTVRAPNTLAVGDRLLLGARILHVEAVSDPDGRGRFSRCRCREEQT